MPFHAILFDFDGLILDTEEPTYLSFLEIYQEYGYALPMEKWVTTIGTTNGDYNPLVELDKMLPTPFPDLAAMEARRVSRELELIFTKGPIPGVIDYLESGRKLGLKIGLASSSSAEWVKGHLKRLGLLHYFDCIRTSDDVSRVKPDPELYISLLDCLQIAPNQACAFEDSPNGVMAARRAGVHCVAIPNKMTAPLSFDHADLRLGSLTDIPLTSLLDQLS